MQYIAWMTATSSVLTWGDKKYILNILYLSSQASMQLWEISVNQLEEEKVIQ